MNCPHCGRSVVLAKAVERLGPRASSSAADTSNLQELLDSIDEAHFNMLDGKEKDFVLKTRGRFDQYGARTMMSDKQMAWLRKIAMGVQDTESDGWS